mmetsp:Transcript_14569/g.35425  ORF Transcript_14569/g.35425 Transcript_14569/m.35425 type:complete len:111 (+) Transcript_14569:1698-2030(+)
MKGYKHRSKKWRWIFQISQPTNHIRHYLSQTWNIMSFQIRNDPRYTPYTSNELTFQFLNPLDRINPRSRIIQLQYICMSGPNLHIFNDIRLFRSRAMSGPRNREKTTETV